MKRAGFWAAACSAALLAGCAHAPPPPPVFAVAAAECPATPDLSKPLFLSLPASADDAKPVPAHFDASSPCLQPAGEAKRVYAVFALPSELPDATIRIASIAFGDAMFAPSVSLLDAHGTVTRQVLAREFVFRGGALTALLREHPGERYILVTSNPDMVGHHLQRIDESVNASTGVMATGGAVAAYSVHTGTDKAHDFSLAVNGTVEVTLTPIPRAKAAARRSPLTPRPRVTI